MIRLCSWVELHLQSSSLRLDRHSRSISSTLLHCIIHCFFFFFVYTIVARETRIETWDFVHLSCNSSSKFMQLVRQMSIGSFYCTEWSSTVAAIQFTSEWSLSAIKSIRSHKSTKRSMGEKKGNVPGHFPINSRLKFAPVLRALLTFIYYFPSTNTAFGKLYFFLQYSELKVFV